MAVTKFQAVNQLLQHKGKAQTIQTIWNRTLFAGDWHKAHQKPAFEMPHGMPRGWTAEA